MREPRIERPHPAGMGGTQKLYRFTNGYGASVVQFPYSYGIKDGLWELAVIRYTGDDDDSFILDYETPITDDVIGHLTEDDVNETLKNIEALPDADL